MPALSYATKPGTLPTYKDNRRVFGFWDSASSVLIMIFFCVGTVLNSCFLIFATVFKTYRLSSLLFTHRPYPDSERW